MKKLLKLVVVLVIVGGVAFAGYRYFRTTPQQAFADLLAPRMTMEVTKGSIQKTIGAAGYVSSVRQKDLAFPSSNSGARILEVLVSSGDRVEAGQVLARVDDREARLNYLQAENEYKRTQINGTATEQEIARVKLELARERLENTEIKSPFTGIVKEVLIEEGDYASSAVALSIMDTRFEIEVSVEESKIHEVQVGQPVKITLDALPRQIVRGTVTEIGVVAQSTSGVVTVPVKVLLEEGDYPIKPGYSADLEIIVGEVTDVIVVPITSVANVDGQDVVYKVVNGERKAVPVQTGLTDGMRIAVSGDLQPGDQILTNTFFQAGDASVRGTMNRMPNVTVRRAF